MIAIVDYGVGNLFSLHSSLRHIGAECEVTSSEDKIRKADGIILPGVGAFKDAYDKLVKSGLKGVIKEEVAKGKSLLGICLGMQLLFDKSYEYGEHEGLSLIPGEVVPLEKDMKEKLKVPHMGWNNLIKTSDSEILDGTASGDYVYFVHSYYARTESKYVTSYSEYGGVKVTASVQNGKVYGTQFHPEKSGEVGLGILKAFAKSI